MATSISDASAKGAILARARAEGFDVAAVAGADAPDGAGARLSRFLALGRQGDMDWLARTPERRAAPRALWPAARSVVMVGASYAPDDNPMAGLGRRETGTVSVYARRRDYHDVMKGALKRLGQWTAARFSTEIKVFVDTAPVMEKPLAAAAGLGWQGKHTNLVSRDFGSWLFLGAMMTALDLGPDAAETDHCGRCRACLDICPTQAFPAPYELDARRCISYLTIEHKGHIAPEFRAAMGNRIFGCDDCLAVCPWNKFAAAGREAKLAGRGIDDAPALSGLAGLDDAGFRQRFAGTPIKRTGRERFVRNVMIAVGNSGRRDLAASAAARLGDPSALVRAMAVWALARLAPEQVADFAEGHLAREADAAVRGEWLAALKGAPAP